MILQQVILTRKIQLLLPPTLTLPQRKNVDFAQESYIAANLVPLRKLNAITVAQSVTSSKAKKCIAALYKPSLLAIPENLKNCATTCNIYGQNVSVPIDSCSSDRHKSGKVANKLNITIHSCNQDVDLASTDKSVQIKVMCTIDIELQSNKYQSVVVGIMENLRCDLILGQGFQQRHETVVIEYGGPLPALTQRSTNTERDTNFPIVRLKIDLVT